MKTDDFLGFVQLMDSGDPASHYCGHPISENYTLLSYQRCLLWQDQVYFGEHVDKALALPCTQQSQQWRTRKCRVSNTDLVALRNDANSRYPTVNPEPKWRLCWEGFQGTWEEIAPGPSAGKPEPLLELC